jgi:GDPmannose 4,6-dehydratase
MRVGVITGITGQDGSYLAELLLAKGYYVVGLNRRTSLPNTQRIQHLIDHERFVLREFDMTDIVSMIHALRNLPENERIEIYNLAAQSHVMTSFYQPEHSANVDALGTLKLLEAIRIVDLKNVRFYQASTSELYGKVQETPQTETTPFYPRSPYGVAKLYSFWIVKNYRESYGMFACSGILFNHESERRGHEFVSRKISLGVVKCLTDETFILKMGNLNAKRDWGHAKDYVEGMWRMLQQEIPDDFILASGEAHTVREFVEKAFHVAGIKIGWRGTHSAEEGYDKETGRILVRVDPTLYRPAEVDILIGNPRKARDVLGWIPDITFDKLVTIMTTYDISTR